MSLIDCRINDIMWAMYLAMLYNYISATHGSIKSVYIMLFLFKKIFWDRLYNTLFCFKNTCGSHFMRRADLHTPLSPFVLFRVPSGGIGGARR